MERAPQKSPGITATCGNHPTVHPANNLVHTPQSERVDQGRQNALIMADFKDLAGHYNEVRTGTLDWTIRNN